MLWGEQGFQVTHPPPTAGPDGCGPELGQDGLLLGSPVTTCPERGHGSPERGFQEPPALAAPATFPSRQRGPSFQKPLDSTLRALLLTACSTPVPGDSIAAQQTALCPRWPEGISTRAQTLWASRSPVPTCELLGTSLVRASGSQPARYTLVPTGSEAWRGHQGHGCASPHHHHPQFERIYCGHSWYSEGD